MAKQANSTGANKISTFVVAATYILLILALAVIAVGIGAFETGNTEATIYLLAIGFIALALSGYYIFQSRKHVASLKIETPPILTSVECPTCKEKVTREFKRGDYVYKEAEKCPKCSATGMIVAIYREATAKEKEKPANV